MIKIRKGLDLPILGKPSQTLEAGPPIRTVALVGFDYHGMKPTMAVRPGDRVALGQELFADKKNPGVIFTSPASGVVAAVNRGAQRVFQSVVIDIDGDDAVDFGTFDPAAVSRADLVDALVRSGLWTALRTRPYSKVPPIAAEPRALFINAMDTNPLAADPQVVIKAKADAFAAGVTALAKLTQGKTYVCHADGAELPRGQGANVSYQAFSGPHPAGNTGTHIHFLDPVASGKVVWSIGYQDVIAVGELLKTGRLNPERVISLAGQQVERPRLITTRLGASLDEITAGQLKAGNSRVISGSVFGGRSGNSAVRYLGRYHQQVSVLPEGGERIPLHFLRPGLNMFSVFPIFVSRFMKNATFNFDTSTNGSERPMVPIGTYEKVMPLDILPTQLLRSLIVGDTEQAQALGCLELDEEDLALCTFACPGKYEYGPILRDNLTRIEVEG